METKGFLSLQEVQLAKHWFKFLEENKFKTNISLKIFHQTLTL